MSGRVRHLVVSTIAATTAWLVVLPPGTGAQARPPHKAVIIDLAGPAEFLEPADVTITPAGGAAAIWEDQGNIVVRRRPAGGVWGPPVTLDGGGKARSPQIESDGSGRLLAAWAVVDHPNAGNGPTRIKVRASSGTGWAPAKVVATKTIGQFRYLDLAVSSSGAAVVGWEWLWHDFYGRLLVTHRRSPSASWATVKRWDGMDAFDVAMSPGGQRLVGLDRRQHGTERILAIRGGLGKPWGAAVSLAARPVGGPGAIDSVGAALDGSGTAVVGWRERRPGGLWRPWASRARAGHPFGSAVGLAATCGGLTGLPISVLASPAGDNLVVWAQPDGQVVTARRPAGGAWAAPDAIAPVGMTVVGLAAAIGGTGTARVVFMRGDYVDDDGDSVQWVDMSSAGAWGLITTADPASAVRGPRTAIGTDGSSAVLWALGVSTLDYKIRAVTYDA